MLCQVENVHECTCFVTREKNFGLTQAGTEVLFDQGGPWPPLDFEKKISIGIFNFQLVPRKKKNLVIIGLFLFIISSLLTFWTQINLWLATL